MTIKVHVVHAEPRATMAVRVKTEELTADGKVAYEYGEVLKPGEERDFWVHAQRRITIEEGK